MVCLEVPFISRKVLENMLMYLLVAALRGVCPTVEATEHGTIIMQQTQPYFMGKRFGNKRENKLLLL